MDSDEGYGPSDDEMQDQADDSDEQPTSEDYGDFSGAEIISNLPKASRQAHATPQGSPCCLGAHADAREPRLIALSAPLQNPYRILPKHQLPERRKQSIEDVTSVLGISDDEAVRLLRKFKWWASPARLPCAAATAALRRSGPGRQRTASPGRSRAAPLAPLAC
jgi:hypothetical protein